MALTGLCFPLLVVFTTIIIYYYLAEWSMVVGRSKVVQAIPLTNWILLYTERNKGAGEDFIQKISQISRDVGIPVQDPQRICLRDDRYLPHIHYTYIPFYIHTYAHYIYICVCRSDVMFSATFRLYPQTFF